MSVSGLKKWVAFGSGVGIQIAGSRGVESLRIGERVWRSAEP